MSITYATPAELAAYIDPDATDPTPPPLASVLIRHASRLVLRDSAGSVYSVDQAGVATDPKVYGALHEATMEQASAWAAHGIDPRKGAAGAPRQVASKALNGAQASYVADSRRDTALSALWAADSLTESAWSILQNAGLISHSVAARGTVPERFTVQRAYDPTTGVLEP